MGRNSLGTIVRLGCTRNERSRPRRGFTFCDVLVYAIGVLAYIAYRLLMFPLDPLETTRALNSELCAPSTLIAPRRTAKSSE